MTLQTSYKTSHHICGSGTANTITIIQQRPTHNTLPLATYQQAQHYMNAAAAATHNMLSTLLLLLLPTLTATGASCTRTHTSCIINPKPQAQHLGFSHSLRNSNLLCSCSTHAAAVCFAGTFLTHCCCRCRLCCHGGSSSSVAG